MRYLIALVLLTGCSGGGADFAPSDGEAGAPTSAAGSGSVAGGSHAQAGSSADAGTSARAGEAGAPEVGGSGIGGSSVAGSGGQTVEAGSGGTPALGGAGSSAGTGGSAGETAAAGAPSEGGAGGSGPDEPPCVCDSGPCCDGCQFRPKSFFCGETIRASTCNSNDADRITHDYWNLFCNGDSTECTRWAVHIKYVSTPCADGLVCEGPDGEAQCVAP